MEGTPQNENKPGESKMGQSDITSLMLFNRNSHFSYIFKKTEKLVTAVYMITNFIKDNEPLKWKIRENALELMALNIAFNTVSLSERRDLIKEYQALSLEVVSLSSIAHHSGLISEMNYQILAREFTNLLSTIEKDDNKKANEETVMLDPRFFEVAPKAPTQIPENISDTVPQGSERGVSYKGHTPVTSRPLEQSRIESKIEYLPVKDMPQKASKPADSKDGRQSIILKLLSKKSGLGIKDFAESIKGCSEKTIQRELLSMVAAGVIKKEGERRWSTYSLA
jgi:hypothetical protein